MHTIPFFMEENRYIDRYEAYTINCTHHFLLVALPCIFFHDFTKKDTKLNMYQIVAFEPI